MGMHDAFMEAVPQRPHRTSRGTYQIPVRYYDGSHCYLAYKVDAASAAEVVGRDKTIEPWPFFGRALGLLSVWEYRETSVGSYQEIGVGVVCRRKGSHPSALRYARDMGAQEDQAIWVCTLPVTTELAHEGGIEVWGYPKYLTSIETRFDDPARVHVRLADELELSVGAIRGLKLRAQPLVTFTEKDGRLIRTRIDVDHEVRMGRGRTAKIEVLGDGPTSEVVRRLGLDVASPLAVYRTDHFRARLPLGVDLGPIAGPQR